MLEYNQLPERIRKFLEDLNKFLPRVEYAVLSDSPLGNGDYADFMVLFDNGEGEILWWGSEWPVFSPVGESMDEYIDKLIKDGNQVLYRGKFAD